MLFPVDKLRRSGNILNMDATKNTTNRTEAAMTTKKTTGKNNARIRHAELQREIATQLIRIEAAVKHHAAGEPKDWGDVGDLAEVLDKVKSAADFINGTNE